MGWCGGWGLGAEQDLLQVCPHSECLVLLTRFFCPQVEMLTSLKALSHNVDPSQMPTALDGSFPYCHSEWVQFFQVSTISALRPAPSPLPFLPSPNCPSDPSTLSGSKLVTQQKFKRKVQSGVIESSGSGARLPGFQSQFCCVA